MIKEEAFFSAILKRSDENKKAFTWLMQEKLYTLVGAIIRMELDSLVRISFYRKSSSSMQERLLIQFASGQKWEYLSGELVRDRQLVKKYFMDNPMLGWAEHIYDVGCAFVHLSPYHDWANLMPTQNLSQEQREKIVHGVNENSTMYHKGFRIDTTFGFDELIKIAPGVMYKLRSNLLCELGIKDSE